MRSTPSVAPAITALGRAGQIVRPHLIRGSDKYSTSSPLARKCGEFRHKNTNDEC